MNTHYDELLVELECPVCLKYMIPPIRQCVTGHSLCEQCQKRMPICPLCQGRFTDAKNISLEALARKMHYPCANSKFGCNARLSFNERDEHERTCAFITYKCVYMKCAWNGRKEDLLQHWLQKKNCSQPYRNTNICHIKIQKTEMYYVNLTEAYDELFWYKFKTNNGKLYWAVLYVGPSEKANNYYFEIELIKPGQTMRRYLFSELCQPVDTYDRDLFKAGSCVMTTMEAADHFFAEDVLLIFYLRIKEVSNVAEGFDTVVPEVNSNVPPKKDASQKKMNFKLNKNFKQNKK